MQRRQRFSRCLNGNRSCYRPGTYWRRGYNTTLRIERGTGQFSVRHVSGTGCKLTLRSRGDPGCRSGIIRDEAIVHDVSIVIDREMSTCIDIRHIGDVSDIIHISNMVDIARIEWTRFTIIVLCGVVDRRAPNREIG